MSADQFLAATNAARYLKSELYNVFENNCADAAFYIFDAAQTSLPKTTSAFPFLSGNGHSPGQLGVDLRNSGYAINTTTGNAPGSYGPCQ